MYLFNSGSSQGHAAGVERQSSVLLITISGCNEIMPLWQSISYGVREREREVHHFR